jgi:hypothetical protein
MGRAWRQYRTGKAVDALRYVALMPACAKNKKNASRGPAFFYG